MPAASSKKSPSVLGSDKIATRQAYGEALLELGREHKNIVVLDADLSGSTMTKHFAGEFPDRFFNVGVAEQNLVGMAAGFALSGLVPFASSFAMFLSGRAWEIIRNSVAYPRTNVKLVASHAGITVGEDGASHQCIEDIATMRVIPGMHVFVPADYHETKQIIRRAYEIDGPVYVRCGRSALPVLKHKKSYQFREGKGEVLMDGTDVSIVACGAMVSEAVLAAEQLAQKDVSAAVINMASVKPIDVALLKKYATKTGCVVTVEEHNVLGGLGAAVAEALGETKPVPIVRLGMQDSFGQSGTAESLMDHYGLRARGIVKGVQRALKIKAG